MHECSRFLVCQNRFQPRSIRHIRNSEIMKESKMKAIVGTEYGSPDVLQVQEVATPTPQDGEVLVKVHAVSVNAADLHLLRGKPFLMRLMGYGLLKPKNTILGAAIAGRVEA